MDLEGVIFWARDGLAAGGRGSDPPPTSHGLMNEQVRVRPLILTSLSAVLIDITSFMLH